MSTRDCKRYVLDERKLRAAGQPPSQAYPAGWSSSQIATAREIGQAALGKTPASPPKNRRAPCK